MHMKKFLIAIAAFALLLPMGCNKQQEDKAPVITLTAGTSDVNTLSFFIEAPASDITAYMVQESALAAPDAATVIAEGKTLNANTTVEETVTELYSNTDYTIYAASSKGQQVAEVASLIMSTTADPSYFADVKVTGHTEWYRGKISDKIDADMFFIGLANTGINHYSALPEGKGEMMWIYLIADKSQKENPALATGTYTIWDGETLPANGTFSPESSKFLMGSSASLDDWGMVGYKSGTVDVKYENGIYTISADMVIEDDEGEKKVKARYCGQLDFEDMTDGYAHFKEDQTIALQGGNAGKYLSDGFHHTSAAFFSDGLLDEEGFIVAEGYLFCMDFDIDGSGEYSPVGTYTVNDHFLSDMTLEAGTYLPGMMYNMYGYIIPIYTYLAKYDALGNIMQIGLVESGDISLTNNNGKWQLHASCVSNKGVKINVEFEDDEFPILDRGTMGAMPARTFMPKFNSPLARPVSVLR